MADLSEELCNRCGKTLNEKKAVWLELNMNTGTWHASEADEVSTEDSQGEFVFGSACAKRVLKGAPATFFNKAG